MKNRILIVGHGLSGALLAQAFLKKNQIVDVCEANLPYHASKVAAGLVNPLIGPKLNPPTDLHACLTAINHLTDYFQKKCGVKFYQSIPLLRVFKNHEQAGLWNKRSITHPDLCITKEILSQKEATHHGVEAPHGLGVTNCMRLHIAAFLQYSKHQLKETDHWISGLDMYETKDYDKIIFCEGFRVMHNPWFSHIPIAPVRGEILGIDSSLNTSVSNGTWAIPITENHFIAGSTWDHKIIETGPSPEGKEQILKSLHFIKIDTGKISKHLSGVRTGTIDRNPTLGCHHKNKKLFLFNGFGSRGSTTIPLHAKQMVEYVLGRAPLPAKIDITRFNKLNHLTK